MLTILKKLIPTPYIRQLKQLWQSIQRIYYRGEKFYCPFCDRSYRKFRSGGFDLTVNRELQIVGSGYRKNMLCPGCYSTDRDRLIYLFLKNCTEIFNKNIKLLHVAPSGALSRYIGMQKNILQIIGTKYHEGVYYPDGIEMIDITSLTYGDHEFDVIFCNHVLEHIPEDLTAMKELYRVLKPGGWALLQVPLSLKLNKTYEDPLLKEPAEREKHFGQFDHVRVYGRDYKKRLAEAGFEVEEKNPFQDDWKIENIEKFAINKEEVLFMAKK